MNMHRKGAMRYGIRNATSYTTNIAYLSYVVYYFVFVSTMLINTRNTCHSQKILKMKLWKWIHPNSAFLIDLSDLSNAFEQWIKFLLIFMFLRCKIVSTVGALSHLNLWPWTSWISMPITSVKVWYYLQVCMQKKKEFGVNTNLSLFRFELWKLAIESFMQKKICTAIHWAS